MTCELLADLRMLDLTDEKGALCGKIFADLGADVIKIEPPEGSRTRRIPPFLDNRPGPDRSTYFLAYEAGKRSITLDLRHHRAASLFTELVKKADFVVESFMPGYVNTIGLDYQTLSRANPRLIHVSITPFGDSGPGRNYRARDITIWAAGGMMYLTGEKGRPPLQMGVPQAGLHAGAEAAAAALIAHYSRQASGLGQNVVVNMEACVVWTLMNEQAMPILQKEIMERDGVFTGSLGARRKQVFKCADGHVSLVIVGGSGASSTKALVEWMSEAGFASDWMKTNNWSYWVPGLLARASDFELAQIAELESRIEQFFMTRTRAEIYREALKRRILAAPVSTTADIAADEQLKARDYFKFTDHDGLQTRLGLPGPFARLSVTPIAPPNRAPMLGEHNQAVYGGLMDLSPQDIAALRQDGVI